MKKQRILCIILLAIVSIPLSAQRYTKVPEGYLMVLRQGDNILEKLEHFALTEKIPSANFTGMGFVNIEFGFFNSETKTYDPKRFDAVELASMNGTIAWKDGRISIHAHGVVTGRDFTAHGGHILSGSVSTGSVEIMILVHNRKFQRKTDEQLGADVLCIAGCGE